MARATAACTCKTCGREFEMTKVCSNRRGADSWEAWASNYYDECSDCYDTRIQRERDEANAAAKAAAEEAGLPELTGSEKQVAWAAKIRQDCYDKIAAAQARNEESLKNRLASGEDATRAEERVQKGTAFVRFILAHTSAAWWIDNREKAQAYSAMDISINFQSEFERYLETHGEDEPAVPASEKVSDGVRKAAKAEMIAAPQEQTYSGCVEITVTETEVSARYEKDDDFRAIVKRLGYSWDADRRVWCKAINATTGTAQERAAELGSNLLNSGFAVMIADPATRAAAINGDYQPEHRRWITAYFGGDYKGWLCVRLPERGDGMYDKARAIKGSRYCNPNVAVPVKRWREVLDFAELNDYRISPAAQEIIDAQRAAIIVVMPAPVKAAVYHETDLADVLSSSTDVLDDLREDD